MSEAEECVAFIVPPDEPLVVEAEVDEDVFVVAPEDKIVRPREYNVIRRPGV